MIQSPPMNANSRLHLTLASCAVAVSSGLLLLATSAAMPMGWDEGDTIARAEAIVAVANSQGGDDGPGGLAGLEAAWPFTVGREGHPPLAGLLIVASDAIAPRGLDPLSRLRLGHMALFAVAAGAMFYRLVRDYRLWIVGIVAVAVLLTMPRMFAHAHFTTYDAPVTAGWVLAWAAFAPACRDWRLTPVFGAALGLAFAAKFTGWLAPVPFLVWAIIYRDARAWRALVVGVPLAVAVFVALNPPLWSEPLAGLRTFLSLNLHRAEQPGLNITTQFFGSRYNLGHPLPWYNTLVWTAITISPMALLLGGIGLVASVRRWRRDRVSLLVVLCWATLIVVRALPWAPPHDGVRLFLPGFAFFAALAGVGAGRALYRESLFDQDKIVAQGWAKVAIALALVMSTFDAIAYFPHGLSYYNRLIGGLRGAAAVGMEATYYWDSLDRETLAWLREHTADDEKVRFAWGPTANLALLKRWGLLERVESDPGSYRWYVVQRRGGVYRPHDVWLIDHARPAYQRSLFGVPLLDVYSDDDYQHAETNCERNGRESPGAERS
ncbi:MAG: DUF2029 domain-containing protein [Planctomycetota bacterium]|nr:MAG: DUF2029 domain-containing protein [Planctomycetota bacterium]